MKVAITTRFLNSYFSGGSPQVACALARTLQLGGHHVTLVYPQGEQDWFMDVNSVKAFLPQRVCWTNAKNTKYDVLIEVVWQLTDAEKLNAATHRVLFVHQPPVFHDIESSVYMWNNTTRSFKNLTAIMTYDFYTAQDVRYLEFLSGVQVLQVPFLWNPEALDAFKQEANLPDWQASAKQVESMLPKDAPLGASWCARIMESNFTNTSHCNIPLNIVTQIRVHGDAIRFNIHNSEQISKNDFFSTNVSRNLLVPDISGSLVPRVRLPDILQDKSVIIAHQRFRPIKTFLLDSLYLGIPLIHNCELLTNMGIPYGYKLNQIRDALAAWIQLRSDYEQRAGFFNPSIQSEIKAKLAGRFSPKANSEIFTSRLSQLTTLSVPRNLPNSTQRSKTELRIHFCELWSEFVPQYNFFMYLLSWVGALNNRKVILDSKTPNLVVYGPLSKNQEKAYPGVSKVFFTGENTPTPNDPDIVLSLGFQYSTSSSYIRFPLWMIELNWFGANVDKIVNPRPVPVSMATHVNPAILDNKSKFCAFVASNPNNPNRNAAFQILDQWRHVDSAGRLMCNRPEGPLPSGLGGGGGELIKVDYYKDYKFVLAYENSAGHGYTTEKIFHAKVAGAVPIYWGDPFVDRDFNSEGFINANQFTKPEDLIAAVQKVADDPAKWRQMASVPALSEQKVKDCQATMAAIATRIFKLIMDVDVKVDSWDSALQFGAKYEAGTPFVATKPTPTPAPKPVSPPPSSVVLKNHRVLVTAATPAYVPAAANLLASLKQLPDETDCQAIVYVWKNVTEEQKQTLYASGATEVRNFPEEFGPWPEFWNPQHFAWKLWLHADMNNRIVPGTSILYLDAGIVLVSPITAIWQAIEADDIFILDDDEQTNERWCHPTFCQELQVSPAELKTNQIWAGCVGFKADGKYVTSIHKTAIGLAETKKDVIVGEKWSPYSATCLGHRHDQSILSILTLRQSVPRWPLRAFYCDKSHRAAQQSGTPFYVHRGQFKAFVPLTEGIDEAYVINLERRSDRLAKFQTMHKNIKDRVYRWNATDGRNLQLGPGLVHCFRNNDFKWKKSVMGCALSHLGLWEKLANDPLAKSYLIMEDDVVMDSKWLPIWMKSAKSIPADADVIYLGGVLPPNKPAFPSIVEKVNESFGRVAKNTLFSQTPRRYFHFCNYAYVLTQQGARKLITLIKDKGIFTSGDHMIVNHGDQLLNIYFTIPLVATCFQEDDPVYQRSEFNNFNRVDTFDSDLWNNTDCFTEDEIFQVLAKKLQSESESYKVIDTSSSGSVDFTTVWKTFLHASATKDEQEFKPALDALLALWRTYTSATFAQIQSQYSMFEQMIRNEHPLLIKYREHIRVTLSSAKDINPWISLLSILVSSASTPTQPTHTNKTPIFYLKTIKPNFLENDWLNELFPNPIEWVPLDSFDDLLRTPNPVLLVQAIPGDTAQEHILNAFTKQLEVNGKTITVLHVSDEFGRDPIEFYKSSSIKHVFRNYPRADLPLDKVTLLPLGYANGRQAATNQTSAFQTRPYTWSFAGSMDRHGRERVLSLLKRIEPYVLETKENWSVPAKLGAKEYSDLLQKTKFVPCVAGFRALESYRLYEALEQGAIPLIVPDGPEQRDTYIDVLGKHPMLTFPSWDKVVELLPILVKNPAKMEEHRQQLLAWWTTKKAELKQQIQSYFA